MGRLVYLKAKKNDKKKRTKRQIFIYEKYFFFGSLKKKIIANRDSFFLPTYLLIILCQNVTFHFNFLCDQLTIFYILATEKLYLTYRISMLYYV